MGSEMWIRDSVRPALADGRAGGVSIYLGSVREDSLGAQRRLADRLIEFRRELVRQRGRDRGLAEGFSLGLDVRAASLAPIEALRRE